MTPSLTPSEVAEVAHKAAKRLDIEQTVVDLVKSGAFDDAIFGVVEDTIRKGPDTGLTETGFVLKMTIALIDASRPRMAFRKARRIAGRAYSNFLQDNGVAFGEPGWDWTGAGARIIAHEYEADHWERT